MDEHPDMDMDCYHMEQDAFARFQAVHSRVDVSSLNSRQYSRYNDLGLKASSLKHSFDSISSEEIVTGIAKLTEQMKSLLSKTNVEE